MYCASTKLTFYLYIYDTHILTSRHFGFYTEKPAIQEVVSIAFDITYFYLLSSDKIINNTKCYLNPPSLPCKINLKSGRCLSGYILYIIITCIQLKTLFPQLNRTEKKKNLWNFKTFQRIKVYEIEINMVWTFQTPPYTLYTCYKKQNSKDEI